jgi:flagellar P-ring protein precursor FlgI
MRARTIAGLIAGAALVATSGVAPAAEPIRVKDVASLQGVSSTPVVGYGLVVGLSKTGDRRQTIFSMQTLAAMLERFGVAVPPDGIKVENVAAVIVTANVPAFSRTGGRVDVTASSVGDARSLQGGVLLPTALRGPEGQVWAIAQGPLSLGGFGGGSAGNGVQVNHLTVGRVPNGALMQVQSPITIGSAEAITLSVHEPDFTNASRIVEAVNKELGADSARVIDSASIAIRVPEQYRSAIPDLVARLETLTVEVDAVARVVINERTGTVVVGGAVRLGPAAVAHGSLSVKISTTFTASQPEPFSRQGNTVVVPNQDVSVSQEDAQLLEIQETATLQDVVRALNALGVTPRDIIAIMQALKAAGALRAELVIL